LKGVAIGTRRQAILFGTLAVLLLFFVVRWSAREKPAGSPTAPVAPSVEEPESRGGRARRRAATPGPDEIPLLTQRDLEPRRRSGAVDTGINLFDLRQPTKPPPPPPTAAPTIPPVMGPLGPPTPIPTPAPPEPPFRLIGIFGPKDHPIAALQVGDELINAREGQVVLRAWIIRKVGYESVDVGFVGYPAEMRRLPITQ
jgi:hypothetical protein